MGINSPENQDVDYNDFWRKLYGIIALILLVLMFLHLVGLLMMTLGILSYRVFVLLAFPFPPFG